MTAVVEEKETGRVEAFSDGVFAIAITLLILELKVPHLAEGSGSRSLAAALLARWPSYLALVTSFFAILIMWANHHAMFNLIRRVNAPFLYANGFLLFVVTLVPFPTALLAEYFERPAAPLAARGQPHHPHAPGRRGGRAARDGDRRPAPLLLRAGLGRLAQPADVARALMSERRRGRRTRRPWRRVLYRARHALSVIPGGTSVRS